MTDKKEHPHALVLREIADGAPLSDFECKIGSMEDWESAENFSGYVIFPEKYQVRRKQKMHRIGEHTFPAPMTEAPRDGSAYYVAGFQRCDRFTWVGHSIDLQLLAFGICHATKEAAEAHNKALAAIARGEPV